MTQQRSTRLYCSDKCRAGHWRADKMAMARTVLGRIRPGVEAITAGWGPMDPTGWRDAVNSVRLFYPDAWAHFTEDVIRAAAQPLPAGTCRSCLALQAGRVHEREAMVARVLGSAPGRFLIGGSGCPKCRQAMEKLDRERCKHCPVRERLAKMPEARQRLGEFTRIVGAAGDGCKVCRETALRVLDGKVHKTRGSSAGSTSVVTSSAQASPLTILASHGPPTTHDPFGTCRACRAFHEVYPGSAAVTAAGFAERLGEHPWASSLDEFAAWFQRRYRGQPEWLLRYRESR